MQCRTPCLIYLRATKLSRDLPEPISPLRPKPDPRGYALRDVRKAPDVRGGAGPVLGELIPQRDLARLEREFARVFAREERVVSS
jgi:hypothetical protein